MIYPSENEIWQEGWNRSNNGNGGKDFANLVRVHSLRKDGSEARTENKKSYFLFDLVNTCICIRGKPIYISVYSGDGEFLN